MLKHQLAVLTQKRSYRAESEISKLRANGQKPSFSMTSTWSNAIDHFE
jgi:hypothetical protein